MSLFLQKKFTTLLIFKTSMIIHAICIITQLITSQYFHKQNAFTHTIWHISFLSLLIICGCISLQSIRSFALHHRYFMKHHKFAGLMVESSIAIIVFGLVFINKEIANTFIAFITDLSEKTHNHTIMLIILLLLLFYGMELYHAWTLPKESINDHEIETTITINIKTLLLKLAIIFGSIVGFIDPIMNIITSEQIKKFDRMVLECTKQDFFTYMRIIIILLFASWAIVGIYYVYNFYKKRR